MLMRSRRNMSAFPARSPTVQFSKAFASPILTPPSGTRTALDGKPASPSEVADGLEGFPASLIDAEGEVALRVEDGSLLIRSPRTATRYVGRDDLALFDEDGFVDTDDMVERRGDRYFFQGAAPG